VRLCVWTVTFDLTQAFGTLLHFENQDHRSKFKVTGKNVAKVVGATSSEEQFFQSTVNLKLFFAMYVCASSRR